MQHVRRPYIIYIYIYLQYIIYTEKRFCIFFPRKLFFERVWWWGRYETLYVYRYYYIIFGRLFSASHKIRTTAFACCNRSRTYRLNSTTIPYRETHKYNDFESRLLYLYIYILCMYVLCIMYISSTYSARRSLAVDDDAAVDTMRNFPSHRL